MTDQALTLDSAGDQLSAAFARLEKAVANAASRPKETADTSEMEASFRQEMGALQSENVQLREENSTLYSQLQQLREAHEELQERNEQIAFQIDRNVEQLELIAN